jgi:hypothetical protein
MTKEHMQRVLQRYIARLAEDEVQPIRQDEPTRGVREHAHWMCLETLQHLAMDAWDKANRWLGHLQALLMVSGLYTLDELRAHNRAETLPAFAEVVLELTLTVPVELTDAAVNDAVHEALVLGLKEGHEQACQHAHRAHGQAEPTWGERAPAWTIKAAAVRQRRGVTDAAQG